MRLHLVVAGRGGGEINRFSAFPTNRSGKGRLCRARAAQHQRGRDIGHCAGPAFGARPSSGDHARGRAIMPFAQHLGALRARAPGHSPILIGI